MPAYIAPSVENISLGLRTREIFLPWVQYVPIFHAEGLNIIIYIHCYKAQSYSDHALVFISGMYFFVCVCGIFVNSSDWCVCIVYDTTSFVFSMYTFIVNNYIFISGKVTYRIVCWYGWGLLYVTPALRVVSLAWPRREGEIDCYLLKKSNGLISV